MPTEKVFVIDRIVEGTAICENMSTGEQIEISTKNLPNNVREGDVIRQDGESAYIIDRALSEQRMAEMTSAMEALFKRKL
jgi:hypothetical protein